MGYTTLASRRSTQHWSMLAISADMEGEVTSTQQTQLATSVSIAGGEMRETATREACE